MPKTFASSLVAIAFAIAAPAVHAVSYNEAVNGELSSNGSSPTALGGFGAGTHSVIGSSANGDIDNFTFTIAPGLQLGSVTPSAFASQFDGTAFIGIDSGNTIVNDQFDPAGLLGYTHFGPNAGNMNTDILDDMGTGFGAQGFTPPLPAGTYTVWIQQAGFLTTYQMDFTVVPEPGSVAALAMGALLLAGARRRSRT